MSREEANRIVRAAQRVRRSRGVLKIALPTAAALGAGAAVATGSIPGGANGVTITGCYAGPDGAVVADHDEPIPGTLRVIDPSLRGTPNAVSDEYSCQEGEKEITWSQSGPAGPTGPTGPQGPQGPPGAGGAQGAAGVQGTAGQSLIGETSYGLTNNAGQTFLKIDGIAGGSTDKYHKDDIAIDSFSLGAQAGGLEIGSATGGAGAGKATIQSFTITKTLDSASPTLFRAVGSGQHFKSAELTFAHKLGGKEQDYLEFKFANVIVSGLSDGQSANKDAPVEQVTFQFQKVSETFLGAGHKAEGTVSWDVVANKAL